MWQKGNRRNGRIIAVIVAILMAVAYIPNVGISAAEEMPDQSGSQTEAGLDVNYDAGGTDEQQPDVSANEDAEDPAETAAPKKEAGEKEDSSVSGEETAEPDKDAAEKEDSSEEVQSTDKPDKDAAEETAGDPENAKVLTAKGKTFKVTITCGKDAKIPKGSTLQVREIKSSTAKYKEYLGKAAEELEQTDSGFVSSARFFDIEIRDADGNEIEPEAEVSVKIDLDNAPEVSEDELTVVHFEKGGPVIMDSKTDKDENICFDTESFSTYAVIATDAPSSVDDLDGWTATFDKSGRYMTSAVNYNVGNNQPFRLGKSINEAKAAEWLFEKSGTGYGYTFYHISTVVNGQKRYLHLGPMRWVDGNRAHLTLETSSTAQGCPQEFAVEENSDGTYSIFKAFPEYNFTRYFINEWEGETGNGFAGWATNNDGSHLNMTLKEKDGKPPVEYGENYAVVIKSKTDPDKYYAVMNDGSLAEVEYNAANNTVKMDFPLCWTYAEERGRIQQYGYDGPVQVLYIHEDATGYDDNQLASGYYYKCINPNVDAGVSEEPKRDTPAQVDQNHPNFIGQCAIRYNNQNHTVMGTDRYLGTDSGETKIIGNVSAGNAAEVYLAKVVTIAKTKGDGPGNSNNEIVSHIDIGIVAKAHLTAPLAYGTYYDENGNPLFKASPDNQVTIEMEKEIPVTNEDIMNGALDAYDYQGNKLHNMFYITGYSANDETGHSDMQVRMEGSFRVTTLDPYTGSYERSNDDPARRADRLKEENQVFYRVTVKKEVSFDLTMEIDGEEVQLYDMHGNKMTVTQMADVSAGFNYWDIKSDENTENSGNECPPLQDDFEDSNLMRWARYQGYGVGNPGTNYNNWQAGAIIDNDWVRNRLAYIGDSGMDFILTANVEVESNPAIEIEKHIVDADGNAIQPEEDVTNSFDVYYKESNKDTVAGVAGFAVPPNEVTDDDADLAAKQEGYEKLESGAEIVVPGGEDSDGTNIYYDYNIPQGMYYVTEDSTSMAKGGDNHVITDINGKQWEYKETRVETEYVWRNDDYSGKRHVVKGYSGVPDVLGEYEFDGWEEAQEEKPNNGFLEFHVYNVYEPRFTKLKIIKELDPQIDLPEDGENATMVFKITGTDSDGEEIYHNHTGLTFNEESGKYESRVIEGVPANAEITVEEIYGGNYKPAGDNPKVAELGPIDPDDPDSEMIWVVEIENTPKDSPGDNPGYGSGVVNKYEVTGEDVEYKRGGGH